MQPADAGNYTVRVTMPQIEEYTGVEAMTGFTIAPKSLEAADITATASDKQYTGRAVTLAAVVPAPRPAAQVPVVTAPATGQVTESNGTAETTQTEENASDTKNTETTDQQEILTAQASAEGQVSGNTSRILVTVAAAALVVLGGGGTLFAIRGKKSKNK